MRINNEVYPSIAMKSFIYNDKFSTSDKISCTCTIFYRQIDVFHKNVIFENMCSERDLV